MLMLVFKSWLRNILPWDYAKRGRAIQGRQPAWSRYLAEASRNHCPPRLFVIFGALKREHFAANASLRTQVLSQDDTHFCTLAHLDNLRANNFQNLDIDIPFKLFCHCRVINAYMHIHFLYFSLQYIFDLWRTISWLTVVKCKFLLFLIPKSNGSSLQHSSSPQHSCWWISSNISLSVPSSEYSVFALVFSQERSYKGYIYSWGCYSSILTRAPQHSDLLKSSLL